MADNDKKPVNPESNPKPVAPESRPLNENLNDIPRGHSIRGDIANNKWDFQDTSTPITKSNDANSSFSDAAKGTGDE